MAELKTPSTNAEQLITEHLDIWTTAIEQKSSAGRGSSKKFSLHGIKKLRELILELAVRGKLVPQDSNDEPASVLLERIAAEKAQLVKDKKIKKPKVLPEISEDEKPFELPQGWEWGNLNSLITVMDAGWSPSCPPEASPNNDVWGVLKTTAVQNMEYREYENKVLSESKEPRPQYEVKVGDILITRAGPKNRVGVSCLVQETRPKLMISDKIIRFHLVEIGMSERFISLCLNAGPTADFLESAKSGMAESQMNISQDRLKAAPIPLAPTREQQRIVAKVDELMSLCDELEAQTENSITAHQTLVKVLLEALLKAPEQTATPEQATAQFQQNWQRLSEHFDTLFTTTASIDTLKQTILQLAVMGKLVPQNPDDEPAAKLLERIAAEKAQLIKDKKIKKQKPLPAITNEEKPFELPVGWEWVNLGELVTIRGGKRLPKGQVLSREVTPYIYIRVSDMRNGSIREDDLHYITEDVQSQISNYIITSDDLYMTIVGATIGKCGLIPIRFSGMNLTENAARLSPFTGVDKYYLFKYLDGDFAQEQFFDKTKQVGVQKMALNRLSTTIVPLPPLEEQRRIVTKVDELIALCDQLKAHLTDAQTTKLHLTDAIVEQAL
ncbi:restriction endonuclease subunit S [Pseudoalteromonas sp. NZS71]|uniref:restriction endonuclease subunit S n=1 Tax=Pseudoalteromonas sp. NZS71 TaxID=2792052 RepID=UPI0018CEF038|nr:restriction endonuclease subunit S [Pseudoalteromonas sp. NZS71]MBH0061447.1 restriction endonuclease subunit S [Pseudoalteromonas sp. NZS71]